MEDPIEIAYQFEFADGKIKKFNVLLDRQTLCISSKISSAPPSWTRLNHHKCPNCTLDEDTHEYCPIALNLTDIAEEFRDLHAYEKVKVTVTTRERTYSKDTTIQEGLSSLIGIIMVTSGCPVMEYLKPMVRFHLPFAKIEETVYRTVSMYVMAQYILEKNGRYADWKLGGLEKIYFNVSQVNRHFAKRLAETAGKDANINALSNLDCFASLVPIEAEEMINSLEGYFHAYLNENL